MCRSRFKRQIRLQIGLASLVFVFIGCSPTPSSHQISGYILGENGQPLEAAYVSIRSGTYSQKQVVGSDGGFSFDVPRSGPYFLTGSGLFHNSFFQPIFVDEGTSTQVSIRMETVRLLPELTNVGIIGEFNEFDDDDGVLPLQKQADGTWRGTFSAPADTFAYQLMGVQWDEYMLEGTLADYYTRDTKYPTVSNHSGKYRSVLNTPGDSVEIVFDPAIIPQGTGALTVEFDDPTSRAARIDVLHQAFEANKAAFNAEFERVRAAGGSFQDVVFDWDTPKKVFREKLQTESDSLIQHYLILSYLEKLRADNSDVDMYNRLLEDVPPSSSMWSFVWSAPANLLYRAKAVATSTVKTDDYALQVADQNPDSSVQAAFLSFVVGDRFVKMNEENRSLQEGENGTSEATQEFAVLFDRLVTGYSKSEYARWAMQQYAPSRAIQPGLPVLPLTARSLPDTSKVTELRDVKGDITLLEFWAIWCGPCIGEMPVLHEAYEKYHNQGLEIVSVSSDENPRDVAAFRADKWSMPWQHLWLTGGWNDPVMKNYEVAGIPKAVLLSEEGLILATDQDLRGEKLLETLETVFANRKTMR